MRRTEGEEGVPRLERSPTLAVPALPALPPAPLLAAPALVLTDTLSAGAAAGEVEPDAAVATAVPAATDAALALLPAALAAPVPAAAEAVEPELAKRLALRPQTQATRKSNVNVSSCLQCITAASSTHSLTTESQLTVGRWNCHAPPTPTHGSISPSKQHKTQRQRSEVTY